MAAETLDRTEHIPRQETSEFAVMQKAVGYLACNDLVLIPNHSVYAILGNANSPTLLEDLQAIKQDNNRAAVGWTVPFERALPHADTTAIADPALRNLLFDPVALTDRFGGLGFLRLPASQRAITNPAIPRGLIGHEAGTVQAYSPIGSDVTSRLIHQALRRNIEPVMSSANFHGHPEIVDANQARLFSEASGQRLHVIGGPFVPDHPIKPLGSYPIVTARAKQLELTRVGCFEPELIARCFDGYPIELTPVDQQQSRYPDNMFGVADLEPKYRGLRGIELRLGILATLGWQADAAQQLNDLHGQ